MHVGAAIARTLETHGVKHVYTVPGESFLSVLDGLYDSPITTVVCRHEGGATFAAEAHGKATGHAGVAMVTRGPGAANAKIGVYTAWQDETPLVLLIGLIPTSDRYRDSFQEFDPVAWFGDITKGVFVIDDPTRASRVVANAFHLAESGRRGPVVIGLPEDIIEETFTGDFARPLATAHGAVSPEDLEEVRRILGGAERPVIFAGGQGWTQAASDTIRAFAETNKIPVLGDMRASDRIAFDSPANAGWLGTTRNEDAARLLEEADVLLAVGAKLSDKPTDNFSLRQGTDRTNIVVNADPDLKAHSGHVSRHILADPAVFAEAIDGLDLGRGEDTAGWYTSARENHVRFSTIPDAGSRFPDLPAGEVDFYHVMERVTAALPDDAIATFGAGTHCAWPQRYFPTRSYPSMLATRLGAMGYSVAAALAAKLALPQRPVVAFTGDGELLMNGQEIVTAVRYGAPMLVVLLDNRQYGTIREHQEEKYPGRVEGTQLVNPDFAAWARSMGAWAEAVERDADVDGAVARAFAAVSAGQVAVLHITVGQDVAAPEK